MRRLLLAALLALLPSVVLAQPLTIPANCVANPKLLCISGRSGAANNPTLSLNDHGVLTGSGTAGKSLKLRGWANATRSGFQGAEIALVDNVTSVVNSTPYSIVEWPASFSFDTQSSIINVFNVSEHRTWTVNTNMGRGGGAWGVRGFVMAPTIVPGQEFGDNNPEGEGMGSYEGLFFVPQVHTGMNAGDYDAVIGTMAAIWNQIAYCRYNTGSSACTSSGDATQTVDTSAVAIVQNGYNVGTTVGQAAGIIERSTTTGTITDSTLLLDTPTIGSGGVITTRRLGLLAAPSGAGTQGSAIGIELADQSATTQVAAVKSAVTSGAGKWHLYLSGDASSLFGGPIVGSDAADGVLRISGTSNADPGTVYLGPASYTQGNEHEAFVTINTAISAEAGSQAWVARGIKDTTTETCNGTFSTPYASFELSPTINHGGLCAGGFMSLVRMDPVLNGTAASTVLPVFGGFFMTPTVNVVNVAASTENIVPGVGAGGMIYSPVFNVTGASGSWTKNYDTGFYYKPSISTNNATGAITLGTTTALYVANGGKAAGGGTETHNNQRGVHCEDLTSATSNICISSATSASGTARWFLKSTGTAPSALAGGLMLGSGTTAPEGAGFLNFAEVASGSCASSEYWVQADSTAHAFKVCDNGTLKDIGGGAVTVYHKLTWFFPGTPTAGLQAARQVVESAVTGCALSYSVMVVGTTSTATSSYNIDRCTANCESTTGATWTEVYSSDTTLPANDQHVAAGTPNTTTVAAGDQFRASVDTVGSGLSDVTITLTYSCEN